MTAAAVVCGACGTEVASAAKYCGECGAPVTRSDSTAEYKQVTVLFADVVRSMDIAAAVGAERLREIMTELFNRSSAVVKRYGGTVDKFTGDGIMAVFGAPVALEDHAFRACLAALDIQRDIRGLVADVELQLRVGLNSGEVIAGEVGSGPLSYTAVGEQVGMAQRMESVAPSGGVMVSESTARLVQDLTVLGNPEMVRIKGSAEPVTARRLVGTAAEAARPVRQFSTLVGRDWEMTTVAGILAQSISGKGRIVGLVGPPGIGKSRLVAEVSALALDRGAEVVTTYCESHTKEVPFHVGARLLRNVFGIDNLDPEVARARLRSRMQDSNSEDVALLEDLLGIRAAESALPDIDPDARRRRVAALLNAAAVARTTPTVFVVEDAHWIDDVSEAMIAEFGTVVPQTHSLVLVSYRPEYHGALDRLPGSHRIALAGLDESASSSLAVEFLGTDPSVSALVTQIAERAAGNPFFVEELVRDLAERGVVTGEAGAYVCQQQSADVSVPASLRATIAARIDRLSATAKRTLNAAAVIGLRFDSDLLAALRDDAEIAELIEAELIDQVAFTSRKEYAFRHALIRTVAYESQLKSDRSQLHRRLAKVIEQRDPGSSDENAALIAEHLEAAGDLRAAYEWHMRAASLADSRDVRAARTSWERARQIADRIPANDPDRLAFRISPRVALCESTWRIWGSIEDAGFDEVDELCSQAEDYVSKARVLGGLSVALVFQDRFREAVEVGSELASLLESIGDPTMTLAMLVGATNTQFQGGEVLEGLRTAQISIDLAAGDPIKADLAIGSPLGMATALRGACRYSLGIPGWREDFNEAIAMTRAIDPTSYAACVMYKYVFPIHNGALLPDESAQRDTTEAFEAAGQSSDDFALAAAQLCRLIVGTHSEGSQLTGGLDPLREYRDSALQWRPTAKGARFVDTEIAREAMTSGDLDSAIELAHASVDFLFDSGDMTSRGPAVSVLVESLLRRGAEGDVAEAQAAIEKLAAVPVDPGFVLHELPLLRLRALLARAHGDEAGYRDFADRYRAMANDLGFEGHMAVAEAMT